MKLKEYIDNLNAQIEINPSLLTLDVITSKDDEGNGYNLVHYTAAAGVFEDGEFGGSNDGKCNAICLN
jgi:hypothetical protein